MNYSVNETSYEMNKFDEENIKIMLNQIGLNDSNYFVAMTKSSLLNQAIFGNAINFANQYSIINFSENEIMFFMCSRLNTKKITNIIKISKNDIKDMKIIDLLISFTFKIKFDENSIKFQLFKKFYKMTKQKENINKFRTYYQC